MTNKEAAIIIVETLREHGYEALFAGGCVRDMLLGREAKDYDVATSARAEEVLKLFKRTLKVGVKFGVVIVLMDDQQVEVATFRTESGYVDGRHPSEVTFTTAKEDASRRDFTINAMFFDPVEEKVIDYFDGREDLDRQIVRTVGDAQERFQEDYLRMLRAIRFSAQLGFKIEQETWKGVCDNSSRISKISGERIRMELEGMLVCRAKAYAAEMLCGSGLAEAIFKDYDAKMGAVGISVLNQLPNDMCFITNLAGFFAGFETKLAVKQCRGLSLSRKQSSMLKFLLSNRGELLDENMSLAKLRMFAGGKYFDELYEFESAIQKVKNDEGLLSLLSLKERIRSLGDMEFKPRPILNGGDLKKLGLEEGQVLGKVADELYIAQLEEQVCNKQQAKQWVKNWLEKNRE